MSNLLATSDAAQRQLLYHFSRVQVPRLVVTAERFDEHLARAFAVYAAKCSEPLTWAQFLQGLYVVDWLVCVGCLEGINAAWDMLFAARTGRSDLLLVDALRARAVRLYPRNAERQETAVEEFWSNLIAADAEESQPVLMRYDGQRPLAPWLIRVFQNWHLSKLRRGAGTVSLPDDDLAAPLPARGSSEERWHDLFVQAARDWLNTRSPNERTLLALRWRYRLSQRDVAGILGVHEGTISRQNDKLRDRALETIASRLIAQGWTGDDLTEFILTELAAVLTDDPRLSADYLAATLKNHLPQPSGESLDEAR